MATVAAQTSSKGARHAALSLGIDGPTKERAMKAANSFQIESTSRAIVVGADDAPRVERATDKRIRMTDNQFERLKRRCELSRNDPDMNRILAAAGFQYARLHYNAGMEALCGFDLSKGFTTARGQVSDAAAERKAQYLDAFRQADDMLSGALGFHALPRAIVVRKVILEDMKLADVGRLISEFKDTATSAAVALHELKNGLRALARHFGLLVDPAPADVAL